MGNGRAEILLGQFERKYQDELTREGAFGFRRFLGSNAAANSNKQQIATKIAPYPWRITRGSLVQAARESLARIGQDKLCVAQLHWSTANYQPFQEGALWEGIADIYDSDLCEAVGISNYGPQQLTKFASRMSERNVPIAIAQVQYSLMTARNNEILDSCNDAGCRLISYSPLCLGLLSGKYDLDYLPRAGDPQSRREGSQQNSLSGGNQLGHQQRNSAHSRREDLGTSIGEPGSSGLVAEQCGRERVRFCFRRSEEENDRKCVPNALDTVGTGGCLD